MAKFAFIGAGSFNFTRRLVRDVLSFPAFQDCTIALMDIDEEKLAYSKAAVEKIVAAGRYPARVTATTSRAEALEGADGVLCTILVGGLTWRSDIEIPAAYGISQCVGDTRGPGGVFRALRTIPVMQEIVNDIERYCPNAIFLNYTNPMAMLIRAMKESSKVSITGLCHSVQHTAETLAGWIGAPMNEVTYLCAGINHMAWYLEFKWNGKDAYPLIREAVKKPEIFYEERVRNEIFNHLDYYVTESSGHFSEYNPWIRKRPDLIEKYCHAGTSDNPGHHGFIINKYLEREGIWRKDIQDWIDSGEPVDLARGNEYAASIFNAVFGDGALYEFNGNVRNFGLIDNLPEGCCVEVPVLASKRGLTPMHIGKLPASVAILTDLTARCEELAVEGALTGDARKVFQSLCYDPLTSAVLSLEEIKNMVDEMFEANREWLPQFKHVN